MGRPRLTQVLPWLLPLRVRQRKAFRYARMALDRATYADRTLADPLPFEVAKQDQRVINPNSGYDIVYQYNKLHNLKLAAATLDGLLIAPGETFSFWWRVRKADRKVPYKDGLVLQDGAIVGGYGGGLCQLSDMLLWLFLHTPLTVTERHPHTTASFAPAPGEVLGIDATVNEGWQDLQVFNPTASSYQLRLAFSGAEALEARMVGSVRCSEAASRTYELYNERACYWRPPGSSSVQLSATVSRRVTDLASGARTTERLFETTAAVGYKLPPGAPVLEGAPQP